MVAVITGPGLAADLEEASIRPRIAWCARRPVPVSTLSTSIRRTARATSGRKTGSAARPPAETTS